MAHMLEMLADGQASMAYAGDLPWHGLGFKVSNDLTPEQMMEAARLDWSVDTVPLPAMYNGQKINTGHSALIRSSDNKVLDVITDDWKPLQNLEAFQFFNDFVGAGDMSMHTAGSLMDGKMVWGLAKINESFELFGGDKVEGFLLFSNPHQYGKSIDVRFTPIRVVCNNTLTLALGTKASNMVKINHRREFDGDMVKETLGVASEKLAKYKEMAAFLGTKRYTNENIVEYFNRIFPKTSDKKNSVTNNVGEVHSRAAQLAMRALYEQPGANFAEGSWWQAYNSVTYLTDHVLGRSADTRLSSAWYGFNQTKKVQALNLAVEMAEAG
jgi:phage/plasmid-like protein (TIGR03299 family)